MTDNERLQAELDEARKLLNLAEDVILGFRSGAISSDGCGEGIWARANDRAGLREMLGQRVGLGGNIWFDTTTPFFCLSLPSFYPSFDTTPPFSSSTPSLPAELLREIIDLVPRTALFEVCLVNTTFREIASPLLYSDPIKFGPNGVWTDSRLALFFKPAASPRFSSLRTFLTLDKLVSISLECHTVPPHSTPISSFPTPLLPKLTELRLFLWKRSCFISFLRAASPLLASIDPVHVHFTFDKLGSGFIDVPHSLWTFITSAWFRLKQISYRPVPVRVEMADGTKKLVPWEIELPNGKTPLVRFAVCRPGELQEAENLYGRGGFVGALKEDFGLFQNGSTPVEGGILLLVATDEEKARYDDLLEKMVEEEHRKRVDVVVNVPL